MTNILEAPAKERLESLGWIYHDPEEEGLEPDENLYDWGDSTETTWVTLEWKDDAMIPFVEDGELVYSVSIGQMLWQYKTTKVMTPQEALEITVQLGESEYLG